MPVSTHSHNTTEEGLTKTDETKGVMADIVDKEPSMSHLLKAFNKGNEDTQKKPSSIENSIAANEKVVEDYIRANNEVVKNLQG